MHGNDNKKIAELFKSGKVMNSSTNPVARESRDTRNLSFSYLFFSDVRKDITDAKKYAFTRDLVEFADSSNFEAVYFPERHFYEFGSIYANNSVIAAYFAPITSRIRLRTAAVTVTLHHPVEIVENWAMVDILSGGRVDLGFGNGWNVADFILSPDTYDNRVELRNERIEIIKKLWRGESMEFPGPGKQMYPTIVYPRPIQSELNVWYVTQSEHGFTYAGSMGYNVFTMLYGIDLDELGRKISRYKEGRRSAGLDPEAGAITLMMHTFVHPDLEWVQRVVEQPFREYIRSSLIPHMKAAGKSLEPSEIEKMIDYSYARYFQTGGIFGAFDDCQKQIDKAKQVGVTEIAFLQDFGVDHSAVRDSLRYLQQLVETNTVASR